MSTFWHRNRKYILGNQQKVVCLILNISVQATYIFTNRLSYFHGHLTCICWWLSFLMSIFTGNLTWLTNRLRKLTEIYGLKTCHRYVRRPSRTYSYCYHVLVSFITVSLGTQKCCHGPTYENTRWRLRPEIVRPSVRNKIFVQFQRLYLYFRGRLMDLRPSQTDNDQRQNQIGMPPKIM